jgi:hypothetical protein
MKKFFFGAILDGNGSNRIDVEVVEDNNICVAAVGCDRETACLIGEEVAVDFLDGHDISRLERYCTNVLLACPT